MKKVILFAAVVAITTGAMAQQLQTRKTAESAKAAKVAASPAATTAQDQTGPDAVIKIAVEKYSFGKIKQGVPVSYSFEIKNISKKPVVIENSYASCGCTTPGKIVEPIAPGATAKLKVQYNAASPGQFTKDVHIKLAGITQEKLVYITGEVVPAEQPKPGNK